MGNQLLAIAERHIPPYYRNDAQSSKNEKAPLELPEADPSLLSDEEVAQIRELMAEQEKELAPYRATAEQLEEHPWLKNAENGLTKIEDIIYNFENGINTGEHTYKSADGQYFGLYTSATDEDPNKIAGSHSLTAQLEQTIQYLRYDDENYTREGTASYTFNFTDNFFKSTGEIENIDFSIDIETTPETEDQIRINFHDFLSKLKDDEDFKDKFYTQIEDFLKDDNTAEMKDYLLNISGLTIEDSTEAEN